MRHLGQILALGHQQKFGWIEDWGSPTKQDHVWFHHNNVRYGLLLKKGDIVSFQISRNPYGEGKLPNAVDVQLHKRNYPSPVSNAPAEVNDFRDGLSQQEKHQ